MSCNFTRFYYCESDISVQDFVRRDLVLRNGIAFLDMERSEADAHEKQLIEEGEDYIRVDL